MKMKICEKIRVFVCRLLDLIGLEQAGNAWTLFMLKLEGVH